MTSSTILFRASVLAGCLVGLVATPSAAAARATGKAANAIYKCVDAAGVTSIQSHGCPPGSTQTWRRDAPREPALTPDQAAQAEAKRLRDQQTVRELSEVVERKLQPTPPVAATAMATAAPAPAPGPTAAEAREQASVEACQAAQAFAGSLRENSWLALTEEQTRRLYGWVAEQCKTPPKND